MVTLIFFRCLCGYVWVNIHTSSLPRDSSMCRTAVIYLVLPSVHSHIQHHPNLSPSFATSTFHSKDFLNVQNISKLTSSGHNFLRLWELFCSIWVCFQIHLHLTSCTLTHDHHALMPSIMEYIGCDEGDFVPEEQIYEIWHCLSMKLLIILSRCRSGLSNCYRNGRYGNTRWRSVNSRLDWSED